MSEPPAPEAPFAPLIDRLGVPEGVQVDLAPNRTELRVARARATSHIEQAVALVTALFAGLLALASLLAALGSGAWEPMAIGLSCFGPPVVAMGGWLWAVRRRQVRLVVDEVGLHVHDALLSDRRTRFMARDEIERLVLLGEPRSLSRRLLALGPRGERRPVLVGVPDWRVTHFLMMQLAQALGVPGEDRGRARG